MTKQEFLEELEDALVGEVSNAVIYDNKQYYDRYITSEVRMGRTEYEVLEELGNPRLLAKTIIEMQNPQQRVFFNEEVDERGKRSHKKKENFRKHPHFYMNGKIGRLDLNTWYGKAFLITIGILLMLILILLLTGIVTVALRIFIPVVVVLVIVSLIKKLFEENR